MNATPSRCAGCKTVIPSGWVALHTSVSCAGPDGAALVLSFCDDRCAGRWALPEAARLRGYLQRIAVRSRGLAMGLASQALFSNLTVDGTPSKKGH